MCYTPSATFAICLKSQWPRSQKYGMWWPITQAMISESTMLSLGVPHAAVWFLRHVARAEWKLIESDLCRKLIHHVLDVQILWTGRSEGCKRITQRRLKLCSYQVLDFEKTRVVNKMQSTYREQKIFLLCRHTFRGLPYSVVEDRRLKVQIAAHYQGVW